jgi:hypothetical protein
MEDLIPINYCNDEDECKEAHQKATRLLERAKLAMEHGLFIEWLECFVAAWNETHNVDIASFAGLEEWDL